MRCTTQPNLPIERNERFLFCYFVVAINDLVFLLFIFLDSFSKWIVCKLDQITSRMKQSDCYYLRRTRQQIKDAAEYFIVAARYDLGVVFTCAGIWYGLASRKFCENNMKYFIQALPWLPSNCSLVAFFHRAERWSCRQVSSLFNFLYSCRALQGDTTMNASHAKPISASNRWWFYLHCCFTKRQNDVSDFHVKQFTLHWSLFIMQKVYLTLKQILLFLSLRWHNKHRQ